MALFIALTFALLLGHAWLVSQIWPPPPPEVAENQAQNPIEEETNKDDGGDAEGAGEQSDDAEENEQSVAESRETAVDAPESQPRQRVTLGSSDPASGFVMLATFDSRGAVPERVELNHPRYRDIDDDGGYLGFLALEDVPEGCHINVVGAGTPAAQAGLQVGDVITSLAGTPTTDWDAFDAALAPTKPGEEIEIAFLRDGVPQKTTCTLRKRPMQLIRPEVLGLPIEHGNTAPADPYSLLLELQSETLDAADQEAAAKAMRTSNWEIIEHDEKQVAFALDSPEFGVRVLKKYRLPQGTAEEALDVDYAGYHLDLEIVVQNLRDNPTVVNYALDGPNGLTTEGWWHSNKVGPYMFRAAGLRDLWIDFETRSPQMYVLSDILKNEDHAWSGANTPLRSMTVDAQYFAASLIPQTPSPDDIWAAAIEPTVVGEQPAKSTRRKLTNISYRLTSNPLTIAGSGQAIHQYRLFLGPKKPGMLRSYGVHGADLDHCIYYGWFWFVAKPMLAILHLFFAVVRNYGLAIVLLTVLVRSCMLPISLKQVENTTKLQELQPETKKIAEIYKDDLEKRNRAMQELYRKHNINPLAGCGPAILQLPIFVGLYRSLMVDIELRQASLIPGVPWASNLAAPDKLLRWDGWLPSFFSAPDGWLGPYLNILPLAAMALFLLQMKIFMPPPADEQAEMQQRITKYMMIFLGVMFFKVAAGLCIYIIASTFWGVAEKKFIHKTPTPGSTAVATNAKKTNVFTKKQPAPPSAEDVRAARKARRRGNRS